MKILKSIDAFKPPGRPVVLTLGFFDGVHLGHQQVLRQVREYKEKIDGHSVAITFENHPSTILKPDHPTELLCTLDHRIQLIENQLIDTLIVLKFTPEFSQQTAESFLKELHGKILFSHFVLGYDATLGKDRQGTPEMVRKLEKELNFQLDYIPELQLDGESVSSTKIRQLLKAGNLTKVERFLGRKFSIFSDVIQGQGLGTKMGFPTANLNIVGLCLPPHGVYAVRVISDYTNVNGVANLGTAPTVERIGPPQLEVYLLDYYNALYGKSLEVIFYAYLRQEQKFPDINALKAQIKEDVTRAKKILL